MEAREQIELDKMQQNKLEQGEMSIENMSMNSKLFLEDDEGELRIVSRFHETFEQKAKDRIQISNWKREDDIIKKMKLNELKPKDIAYNSQHGYIYLLKKLINKAKSVNPDTLQLDSMANSLSQTWSCIQLDYIKQKEAQRLQSLAGFQKVNVDEKDMKFTIQINIVCVVDNKFSQQIHKVKIKDQIQSIIKPLEKLYQCKFDVISNQKLLRQKCSFRSVNIVDGQTLQLFGIPKIKQIDGKPIRFFQRFQDFKQGSSWPLRQKVEGIILKCKVDVIIFGVGIFESYDQPPGPFRLGIEV